MAKTYKDANLSRATRHALSLLASEIRLVRAKRRMSQSDLASRVGCSRDSIIAIEAGKPTVAIGIVFEAASVLGIELFGPDKDTTARLQRNRQELKLLPSRARDRKPDFNDDF